MHKALPIEIVDVSLWASAHEPGGNHRPAIKASFFVQAFAMDQPAGALALLASRRLLNNEPFWKPPNSNSSIRLSGIILHRRGRIKPRSDDARHDLELAREPRLQNLFQITDLRPS